MVFSERKFLMNYLNFNVYVFTRHKAKKKKPDDNCKRKITTVPLAYV